MSIFKRNSIYFQKRHVVFQIFCFFFFLPMISFQVGLIVDNEKMKTFSFSLNLNGNLVKVCWDLFFFRFGLTFFSSSSFRFSLYPLIIYSYTSKQNIIIKGAFFKRVEIINMDYSCSLMISNKNNKHETTTYKGK